MELTKNGTTAHVLTLFNALKTVMTEINDRLVVQSIEQIVKKTMLNEKSR